ncbi:MAG: hypothetical protein WD207_05725 [Xanthobacteraceae bacterium]
MNRKPQYDLDGELLLFEQKLPAFFARVIDWVRRPTSRLVRLPLGGILVIGGLFGFLPILGFWMLPLGLLLLARDIPALEPPLARMLAWINRSWPNWKASGRPDQPPT